MTDAGWKTKWWAGCPEHGRKAMPDGSCHECAMLMPRPDDRRSGWQVGIDRITDEAKHAADHEDYQPDLADYVPVTDEQEARAAAQLVGWEIEERGDDDGLWLVRVDEQTLAELDESGSATQDKGGYYFDIETP